MIYSEKSESEEAVSCTPYSPPGQGGAEALGRALGWVWGASSELEETPSA